MYLQYCCWTAPAKSLRRSATAALLLTISTQSRKLWVDINKGVSVGVIERWFPIERFVDNIERKAPVGEKTERFFPAFPPVGFVFPAGKFSGESRFAGVFFVGGNGCKSFFGSFTGQAVPIEFHSDPAGTAAPLTLTLCKLPGEGFIVDQIIYPALVEYIFYIGNRIMQFLLKSRLCTPNL